MEIQRQLYRLGLLVAMKQSKYYEYYVDEPTGLPSITASNLFA